MKQFLNHQSCVGYMELVWRGGRSGHALPEDFSVLQTVVDMLLPVRLLSCFQRQEPKGTASERNVAVDITMLASLRSQLLGKGERLRATGSTALPEEGEDAEEVVPSARRPRRGDGSTDGSDSEEDGMGDLLYDMGGKLSAVVTDMVEDMVEPMAFDSVASNSALRAFYR